MEENNKTVERINSTKISINAKGQYSGEIKVYAETVEESYRIAIIKAEELETLIRKKNNI